MFTPTARQRAGLASLERFAGITAPRTDFPDREAFTAYWDSVVSKGDAAKRSRTPAATAARQERIAAYYQDDEALYRYGRAYGQRFQPSSGRLLRQIQGKCRDPAVVARVMARLAEHVDDRARIRELAEVLRAQGKHGPAIRAKLRERLFPVPLIDACLEELTAAGEGSLLDAAALDRQVGRLRRKGLSQRAIATRLTGGAGDRAAVQRAVGPADDTAALRTAYAKLMRRPRTPREVTQRLLAKGFRYGDITAFLAGAQGGADPTTDAPG